MRNICIFMILKYILMLYTTQSLNIGRNSINITPIKRLSMMEVDNFYFID